MKNIILWACIATLSSCSKKSSSSVPPSSTDSFTVTVNNGYGSGKYKTGDTVHIFSLACAANQLFNAWSSADINLLNASEEWHTWFIMPSKNLSFSGSLKNIVSFTLQFEQIKGKDRMKPVYYYFPTNHKGIVYLLHGSSGSAATLVSSYEWQQMIKDLVNDGFAVVITEAEEATTGIDMDGDGKIGWNNLPWDTTTNPDFANIRIITDTFYNRGMTNQSKPKYSVGMSNGGNFSTALSTIYNFKSGICYCAFSGTQIAQITQTPLQFCMARFDNNPNVGPTGNANALSNSQTLTSRGICSKYLIKERAPLYPERFARSGDISIAQSDAIFTELKSKGFLDSKNYFIGYSDTLQSAFTASPQSFPQLNSLTPLQFSFVLEQISLSVSDHHMYSDYNRATLKFLNTQCQ